ncbi:hypothetical protein [Lactobacillus acetotolerans]|uniref:Uncharacterized protein n=1 Tax=Lactobacillus acetotolerans TaxID=1600 RepID=A0A5P5ZKU1_9LACO|nr:hypothetical protein [Lactobacillus acetotolerans]KRN41774.1 hypothetical protein FC77_GL001400 [Lactobacillus acetotolerans DSM 20749 = JCM 3825]QFG51920.1 hypothetical protein LA749_08025 [Lactobacillus acetotolerans]GGV09044.1 hypothetical protein GCM10011628_02800 [Lactobacillus acetotolerans DSM 20749 = JCM 3825]
MTLAGVTNRIKRIEKAQHPSGRKMLITYAVYDKWLVKYDGEVFDTLEQAIDYLKHKYRPAKVLINDYTYNLFKMSMDELERLSRNPDNIDDEILKRATKPTKAFEQVIKEYPKLDIEHVFLSDEEKEQYCKQ